MSLINREGSGKVRYTRAVDEQIVALVNEGTSFAEIAKTVGHSEASISYRVYRVLSKVESLDQIKYK